MTDNLASMSDEEFDKWFAEQPKPPPIPERTDEQLRKQFDFYQTELMRMIDGTSQMYPAAAEDILNRRLEIALELHKRDASPFKGESPLENEGIENEFFEALMKLDRKEFYRFVDAPVYLLRGLTLMDLKVKGAAFKTKINMMGELEQLHDAMILVHHIHEKNKKYEAEGIILEIVEQRPGITAAQLTRRSKLSASYVNNMLDVLHDEGKLKKVRSTEPPREDHWFLATANG